MQRGHGIIFHKSPYYVQPGYGLQSGDGFGSFFRSIFKFLAPAAKKTIKTVGNIGKQILSNPGVKDVIGTVKDEAIRTGVNAVANAIAGDPLINDADIAETRDRVATSVRKIHTGSGKKRTTTLADSQKQRKRKKQISEPDLFSE